MATPERFRQWQTAVGAAPDGAPGPRTYDATVSFLRARGLLGAPAEASAVPVGNATGMRGAVAAVALGWLGEWSEARIDALWLTVGAPEFVGLWHEKSWCGAFALQCLRQGLGVNWHWKPGVGFLGPHGLRTVSLPEVGDIAYFTRNQHHAVVVGVGAGKVELVNGNGLTAPREGVTLTQPAIRDVSAFYSIQRWIQ